MLYLLFFHPSLSSPPLALPLPTLPRVRDATPPTRRSTHALRPPGALRSPRLRGVQAAATSRAELCPVRRVPRRDGPLAAAACAEARQAGHRTGGAAAPLFYQARAETVRPVRAGAADPRGAQTQGLTESALRGGGRKSALALRNRSVKKYNACVLVDD